MNRVSQPRHDRHLRQEKSSPWGLRVTRGCSAVPHKQSCLPRRAAEFLSACHPSRSLQSHPQHLCVLHLPLTPSALPRKQLGIYRRIRKRPPIRGTVNFSFVPTGVSSKLTDDVSQPGQAPTTYRSLSTPVHTGANLKKALQRKVRP